MVLMLTCAGSRRTIMSDFFQKLDSGKHIIIIMYVIFYTFMLIRCCLACRGFYKPVLAQPTNGVYNIIMIYIMCIFFVIVITSLSLQHTIISRNLRAHSDCACMVTWLGVTCFAGFHIYYIYLRLCLIFKILYNP